MVLLHKKARCLPLQRAFFIPLLLLQRNPGGLIYLFNLGGLHALAAFGGAVSELHHGIFLLKFLVCLSLCLFLLSKLQTTVRIAQNKRRFTIDHHLRKPHCFKHYFSDCGYYSCLSVLCQSVFLPVFEKMEDLFL